MPRCHKRERILEGWEVEEAAESCKQQITRIYPPNELLGRQSCVGTQAYADTGRLYTGRHRHTRSPAHRLQRHRHTGLQTSTYRQAGKGLKASNLKVIHTESHGTVILPKIIK